MKIYRAFIFAYLLLCTVPLTAQESIGIPFGDSPLVDGVMSPDEWSDAESVSIESGGRTITVLLKHDGENLYLAFRDNLQAGPNFPEVLLDPDNAKSDDWQADDHWFHVSARDCDSRGEYGNYANCNEIQADWTGSPNFSTMPNAVVDTVEIQIPFAKFDFNYMPGATIGLALNVTNTFNNWAYWPAAADKDSPSTWATAEFLPATATGLGDSFEQDYSGLTLRSIAPHPLDHVSRFGIVLEHPLSLSLRLYDAAGRAVAETVEQYYSAGTHEITLDLRGAIALPVAAGTYTYQLLSGGQVVSAGAVLLQASQGPR